MQSERVFLSFLGLGRPIKDAQGNVGDQVYDPTDYVLDDGAPLKSRYVQSAILQRAGAFDRAVIAMTPQSKHWHWESKDRLKDELERAGVSTERCIAVDISEKLDVSDQWENFGKIVLEIPAGARLCVDLTHGFRVIPVLFSVAIELLTQIKGVQLEAVWYGAYEPGTNARTTRIIDISKFFGVTRWAEAVRAVTEELNPGKLAALAVDDRSELKIPGLSRPALAEAMSDLAATVKNANAAGAPEVIRSALKELEAAHADASALGQAMLGLLESKFGEMCRAESSTRFTPDWYHTQLTLAKLMMEHGLLMQGLTVHQELLTSCFEEICARVWYADPCSERERYSETHKPRDVRDFGKERLRSFGESLRALVALEKPSLYDPIAPSWDQERQYLKPLVERTFDTHLRGMYDVGRFRFLKDLGDLRNRFNHAWMGKKAMEPEEVMQRARGVDAEASALVDALLGTGLIGRGEPP
jgi:CRISPR-associated DxTHG motif protein